ncbi:aldo keto reductase isoform B, partial [Haematococcus lacustris]
VGITNFDTARMQEMVDAGAEISSNQIQYSLMDRRPEQGPMAAYCAAHAIALLPYGTVAGGLLSSEAWLGKPAAAVPLNTFSRRKYAQVIDSVGGWERVQRLLGVLASLATKHGTSSSNVATK